MGMQGADDATLCRGFRTSLRGPAVSWYNGLPHQSVDSFEALAEKFVQQFLAGRKRLKAANHLLHVKQTNGETLRAFFERFSRERLMIVGSSEELVMNAFMAGTNNRHLQKTFLEFPPQSLEEVLERAERRMVTEETLGPSKKEAATSKPNPNDQSSNNHRQQQGSFRGKYQGVPQQQGGNGHGGRQNQGHQVLNLEDRPQHGTQNFPTDCRALPANFDYTPLKYSILEVFSIARSDGYLPYNLMMSRRSPDAGGKGRGKYCQYHCGNGHSTEECTQLKKDIERLIRGGHLKKVVVEQGNQDPVAGQEPAAAVPEAVAHGVPEQGFEQLNAIEGGPSIGGSSHGALKAKVREVLSMQHAAKKPRRVERPPLSFFDRDRDRIISPHHDALVIRARVGTYDMGRLLVDTGSSCDVIFKSTLKRMGIEKPSMTSCVTPITGFTGDSVPVLGIITLPISLGQKPQVITRQHEFVVVDVASAYNAIIGRPYLEVIEASSSIACLGVKFHTPAGVGEVWGCQQQSRECCLIARKIKGGMKTLSISICDNQDGEESRPATIEDVERLMLDGDPEKTVAVGKKLPPKLRKDVNTFLQGQADMFAWTPEDSPGAEEEGHTHLQLAERLKKFHLC